MKGESQARAGGMERGLEGLGGGKSWKPLAASPSSDEPPHLQLHDSEVVGFREAAVVEGVAGAAAAQVQVLVHPQSKVAAAWDKDLFICIHLVINTKYTQVLYSIFTSNGAFAENWNPAAGKLFNWYATIGLKLTEGPKQGRMDGRYVKWSPREDIRFVENMFQCILKMLQQNMSVISFL